MLCVPSTLRGIILFSWQLPKRPFHCKVLQTVFIRLTVWTNSLHDGLWKGMMCSPFSSHFFSFLFIEPLTIDFSRTAMNEVFRGFTNETTFDFNCSATGTSLSLVWYKHGEQISVDGTSLTIPYASPMDNGVYQCFWTSELRPSQIFDSVSWALAVRDRGRRHFIHLTLWSSEQLMWWQGQC